MEFFLDIASFFLKTLIIVALLSLPIVGLIVALKSKNLDDKNKINLRLIDLKDKFKKRKKFLEKEMKKAHPDTKLLGEKELKDLEKEKKKNNKNKLNNKKKDREAFVKALKEKEQEGVFCPKNLFVINFNGDTKGSEVENLRQQVDAILDVATDKDEVIVNLTSPGGMVNSYGLCASELTRIRDRNINLVCTVDSVAASGGYLMACVANKIVAAPFSYIGSVGVVASIPNFNKVLNKHDIEYEQITAGKYKRTLTFFGENTDEGRAKFKEELELIHMRFKEQILKYRPNLDIDKIATGEHWLAMDALNYGLIDEISTSDEYIYNRTMHTYDLALKIDIVKKENKTIISKIKELLVFSGLKNSIKENILTSVNDDETYKVIR